jgi:uncharacterized protein DUF2442
MSFSAAAADERVLGVQFSNGTLCVTLKDGRVISVPLSWYPRLLSATLEQRKNWKVAGAGYGIHWPDLDEDLSTEGLLRGIAAPGVHGTSEPTLGNLDEATLISLGVPRPVQSSALDAAGVDAADQVA